LWITGPGWTGVSLGVFSLTMTGAFKFLADSAWRWSGITGVGIFVGRHNPSIFYEPLEHLVVVHTCTSFLVYDDSLCQTQPMLMLSSLFMI
jgi:hypothetical protein